MVYQGVKGDIILAKLCQSDPINTQTNGYHGNIMKKCIISYGQTPD